MQIGIIGLKEAGKSSLFDILTGHVAAGFERSGSTPKTRNTAQAGQARAHRNGPKDTKYGAGESRHGVMHITDDRLDFLQKASNAKKIVQPFFELLDLPPLQMIKSSVDFGPKDGAGDPEASGRAGLPVPYLADSKGILEEAKNCGALIQVVRQFTDPAVSIGQGGLDPFRDKRTLDAELILVDLSIVENRLKRIEQMKHKVRDFYQPGEPKLLRLCQETLEREEPLSALTLKPENDKLLRGFQFLTIKPRISIINIDEPEINNHKEWVDRFEEQFPAQRNTFGAICCQTEKELLELPEDEREEFRIDFGIDSPAVSTVTELLMKTMSLIRFLTAAKQAAQSWIVAQDTPARTAAGAIHSDMERGFIRAEVVTYDDYRLHGTIARCKEKGCFRLEGKEYAVQDGDVIFFRFNV